MKFKDWPKVPLVMIALMLGAGLVLYPYLPARIPVHWGLNGIDRWAATSPLTVFQMPLVAVAMYLLLMVAPFLDPKRTNLMKSRDVYALVVDLVVGLLALVHFSSLAAAFRPSLPVDRVILLGVGVMFVVLGSVLGRVQQNWTMGVRVPWTLEDPEVWRKTNRLGGRLFVVAGVMALIGAFLPSPWHIVAILGPALGIVPIVYAYGYLQYRRRHREEMSGA